MQVRAYHSHYPPTPPGQQLDRDRVAISRANLTFLIELDFKSPSEHVPQHARLGQFQIITPTSRNCFKEEVPARRQRTLEKWKQGREKEMDVNNPSEGAGGERPWPLDEVQSAKT